MQQIDIYLSILLVEDEDYKLEKVKTFLMSLLPKAKIIIAKDQIQAQKSLKKEKFDLMILDMQLPIRIGEGDPEINGGENILQELEDRADEYRTPNHILGLTQFAEAREGFEHHSFTAIKFDASSDIWKTTIYKRLVYIQNSGKSPLNIIYCENQNDSLYNLIGFPNVVFRGVKDSRAIYLSVKNEQDKFALRDKDFLTEFEKRRLKDQFKNYLILDYYCFENYLYHPENLIELKALYNIDSYIKEIINQKKLKLNKILFDIQASRKNYLELNDPNFIVSDKNPENVISLLMSDDFETFYPFFDMKGTDKSKSFDKSCLNKYNLKEKDLVSTSWFKQKISVVISDVLNND